MLFSAAYNKYICGVKYVDMVDNAAYNLRISGVNYEVVYERAYWKRKRAANSERNMDF